MKVSGFTFLRNAITNGYPFVESIKSILPIVDEFICAVGPCDDDTIRAIQNIQSPKIVILQTCWNDNMRDRGFVYGQQKMIAQYNCTGDWAFYLEGDEVLHESQLPKIYENMESNLHNELVEAFYFNFLHFYGTPFQTGIGGYRRAPRIIRNTIRTIAPDGLFWVVMDKNKRGRYPRAKFAGADIFHYGHCRRIDKMNKKLELVGKYWNRQHAQFEGYGNIDLSELVKFEGVHPAVMKDWIEREAEHRFDQNPQYHPNFRDIRNRLKFWVERKFDCELSKKHYTDIDDHGK